MSRGFLVGFQCNNTGWRSYAHTFQHTMGCHSGLLTASHNRICIPVSCPTSDDFTIAFTLPYCLFKKGKNMDDFQPILQKSLMQIKMRMSFIFCIVFGFFFCKFILKNHSDTHFTLCSGHAAGSSVLFQKANFSIFNK